MTNSDRETAGLERLGFLLRLYRTGSGGGREMPRGEALALMAERNSDYANLSVAELARWENGESRPARKFLVDFARLFGLSQAELDAMLEIGDYALSYPDERDGLALVKPQETAPPPPDLFAIAKNAMQRVTGPQIYAVGVGYSLNALGQDGTWILAAYSAIAFAIVGGQGVLRWRRRKADAASELFFITLFFILNAPMFLFSITRMDHFGFFALIPWGGSYFMLATLVVNLLLALAASALFEFLRVKMYGRNGPRHSFARALWTVMPPCLFVFFNMAVFVNAGEWAFFLATLGVTVGAFTTILAFQDDEVTLSEWEAKTALVTAIAVIILLCAVGAAGTLVAYISPSPLVIPDHNLIMSWEIDYERVGYPEDEALERFSLGLLMMGLAIIVYLATALGSFLLVAIRRQAARYRGASGEGAG